MVRITNTAIILTGVSPSPATGEDNCRYVQIRNLALGDSNLVLGRRPTAARALPIQLGDVLLAARGDRVTAVNAVEVHFGAYAALDIYLIRPDQTRLNSLYLAAFLMRATTGIILRMSTAGASLPRIPKDAIENLQIPLPPIERQRAIGGVASCIHRHREIATRLIAAEAMLADTLLERVFAQLN